MVGEGKMARRRFSLWTFRKDLLVSGFTNEADRSAITMENNLIPRVICVVAEELGLAYLEANRAEQRNAGNSDDIAHATDDVAWARLLR
jgi:hypothetical protein